ncbi:hypothetical protein EK904_007453 [Melospiza melodia maxima]|nr:hypothetical protein EK904_007453 [Melospiza melodia maxima]
MIIWKAERTPSTKKPRYECLSRMSRHAKKLRDQDINPCLAHGIMMQRKRSGVKPEMPSAEERKKILESMGKPY